MLVFAPPKSMTFKSFLEKFRHDDDLVAENYIEGTVINYSLTQCGCKHADQDM